MCISLKVMASESIMSRMAQRLVSGWSTTPHGCPQCKVREAVRVCGFVRVVCTHDVRTHSPPGPPCFAHVFARAHPMANGCR